ncbi:hypothetical protein [Rhodopseudomonas sp. B29]|uniref:hypothetical protein n=1 Tax=Rhodopseudomonas sp. B29 TaxID=95607 RepID=UPI0003499879|nr:hypothetical protein [Rhodopseudomonas sp. B29]
MTPPTEDDLLAAAYEAAARINTEIAAAELAAFDDIRRHGDHNRTYRAARRARFLTETATLRRELERVTAAIVDHRNSANALRWPLAR